MKTRKLFGPIIKSLVLDKGEFYYEYNGEFCDSTGSVKVTIDDVDNIVSNVVPKLFTRIEERIDKKALYVYVPKEVVKEVERVLSSLKVLVTNKQNWLKSGHLKVEINEVPEYSEEIESYIEPYIGRYIEPIIEEIAG